MIADEAAREKAYEQMSKAVRIRIVRAFKIPEEELAQLSLAGAVNLLFLFAGEWGSLGDYITTFNALTAILGSERVWAPPQKQPQAVPSELVQ